MNHFTDIHIDCIQILNLTTLQADKVAVPVCAGIEAVCSVQPINLLNLTGFTQKGKIPVHSAQADIGTALSDIGIDQIRSRVIGPSLQKIQDKIPLAAMFSSGHGQPSLMK